MRWNRNTGKRTQWGKAVVLSVCLCISGVFFTACGKKAVIEGGDLIESEIGSMSDEENVGIPKRVEDSSGLISIDAEVIAEGYGNQAVAIMKPDVFDEEDIKYYAETVFDEGSAEVVLPYKYCSKNFLLNEQAKIKARIKELGYTEETVLDIPDYMYLGYQLIDIQNCLKNIEDHHGADERENDGSYQWIEASYKAWYEDYDIDMLTCQIKGTIEGKEYAMYFIRIDEFYSIMCIFRITEMHYAEELDILDEEPVPISPDAPISNKENTCSLTEEDAAAQVETFVNKLGIEGYIVNAVYPAQQHIWHYEGDDEVLHNNPFTKGYLVYLGREIRGYAAPHLYPGGLETNCLENSGTRQEGMIALVTDEGIERFQYVKTMEISEIATEQTTVMSFEDIQKSALDYFKSETDEYVIDTIRLCMGLVKEGESYAYIPVWCYEYNPGWSKTTAHRCAYMINAIDGSIIDSQRGYTLIRR
ncbi:MAG: hypothetical protein K2G89_09035 [Lachnospiraceae bacterium]|nr:hypothetical protein [Lachnospiraceae bacterium]